MKKLLVSLFIASLSCTLLTVPVRADEVPEFETETPDEDEYDPFEDILKDDDIIVISRDEDGITCVRKKTFRRGGPLPKISDLPERPINFYLPQDEDKEIEDDKYVGDNPVDTPKESTSYELLKLEPSDTAPVVTSINKDQWFTFTGQYVNGYAEVEFAGNIYYVRW